MSKLFIEGPVGRLEASIELNGESQDWLVVCHPHPLHGGTMTNKVVTTLGKSYFESGMNVMKFNYRSVGQSDGQFDDSRGEVDDCLAVIAYIQAHYPIKRLFLAGFSFGCYIAAKAASVLAERKLLQATHLLLIAPSVINSPFEQALPLVCPAAVIMGDADEVVPFEAVSEWVDHLYPPVQWIEMPQASHFFHGRLIELREHVKTMLKDL